MLLVARLTLVGGWVGVCVLLRVPRPSASSFYLRKTQTPTHPEWRLGALSIELPVANGAGGVWAGVAAKVKGRGRRPGDTQRRLSPKPHSECR